MLQLSNINTFYRRAHILRDIDLTVGKGEIVALLGRNGAGKTTTIKTVMGIVKPKIGTVRFNGEPITGLANHKIARKGIGYVPEERRIFPKLTVLENLCVGEKDGRQTEKSWNYERIFELFPKLEELKNRHGGNLSGGEQQMLTVARTLMGNPKFLLLDEPTEGLAPIIVQQMIAAISALKEEGYSVLLSEQNQRAVAPLCDRAYILEKGRIVFHGTMEELEANKDIEEQYISVR